MTPGAASLSPLVRLDARLKLVVVLLLIAGVVALPYNAWPAYPLLWAVIAATGRAGELSAWRLARRAAVVLPFALAAVTLAFATPGTPVVTVGGLTVTDRGLERFAAVAVKAWLAAQAAQLLTATTPFPALLDGLRALGVPDTLVETLRFMDRYRLVLQQEAASLSRARASRSATAPGGRAGGRFWWRGQVAGSMIGNLFLRTYERGERVYAAMQARGYGAGIVRLRPTPVDWRASAWAALPLAALALVLTLAFAWAGR